MSKLNSSPRFITIENIVKGILLREKDFAGADKLMLMAIAKDLYKELNLGSIRNPVRRMIEVDKRTNSINFPDDYMTFSSISEIDECGRIEPLIINTNIKSDMVDISLVHDCGCECGCQSQLCSAIKNYEIIQEDISIIMPDSSTQIFTATKRKKILSDGSYVMETVAPVQKFDNGVYVAVVMETTDEFLCHLEMNDCGCIKHTHHNEEAVNNCSNARDYNTDCGCTECPRGDRNTYNFSEEGDRIQLDSRFRCDHVLLRYYADLPTKDILVPIIARKSMVSGIKSEQVKFDDKATQFKIALWASEHNKDQIVLRDKLNQISLKKFLRNITPKRKMV